MQCPKCNDDDYNQTTADLFKGAKFLNNYLLKHCLDDAHEKDHLTLQRLV